jgi:ribosomal 30S subunit maturation factor RimM
MYSIGKKVKPQGIKGEVKAEIITSFPEHFLELDELSIDFNGKLEAAQLNPFEYPINLHLSNSAE